MKIEYFKKCLEKDAQWYDERNAGEMGTKIAKETLSVEKGTGDKIANVVMAYFTFLFGFAGGFYFGWKLTLILMAGIPIIGGVGVGFSKTLTQGMAEEIRGYAQSAGYAEQALSAIRIVHTFGQEKLELTNYSKYLERARQVGNKKNIKSSFFMGALYFAMFGFYGYTFFFGGYLRYSGNSEYTGGTIITVLFCVIMGCMQLGFSGVHLQGILEGRVAGKMVFDVIDHTPEMNKNQATAEKVVRSELKGHIEFKNVNFTYPTRRELQVLKNFTCTFEAGKTYALVGPSGSGKSTIIQLLERFYDPTSGTISLDGKDFKNLNIQSMRQNIGYVGQEPVMFNTTIRENMLFAKPDATEDEIIEALKAANAWDFIRKKMSKDGIDTTIGGSGGMLSGGQKQRIAIARAFLKKPKILLLDEATSALDKVNEKAVQEAIDNYRKTTGDITIVVIAHRLTTIRDADKILVLKHGELIEEGSHDELLA